MLFSASLALIIEHLGYLTVVSKISLLLVSNLAAQHIEVPTVINHGPYVVAIGEADFQERYRERSPLDHCLLARDLLQVMEKGPAQLAVDIDLSPPGMPDATDLACQARLDAFLDAHAPQIVAITPNPAASPQLRQSKFAWIKARCAAGVRFASPYLERSLRMVLEQRDDARDSLAFLAHDPSAPSLCAAVHTDPQGFIPGWLDPAGSIAAHRDSHGEREPINFALAAQRVPAPLAANAPNTWPALARKVVFFGGVWGHDDTYITPIGEQSGVWIHAARLITLEHPVQPLPPVIAFLLDLVTGFAFAILIGGFWKLYIGLRVVEYQELPSSGLIWSGFRKSARLRYRITSAWSSLVLLSFVLAYVLLCLSFFFVARYLFVYWGLLIAPLVIAISMLSDGFMSGPVEVLTERILRSDPAASVDAGRLRCWLRQWALGAFILVLVACVAFMLLISLATQPGAWLSGSMILLLLALAVLVAIGLVRPVPKTQGEKRHVLPEPGPDQLGIHRFIRRIGQFLGLLRSMVFMGVVVYAMWILFVL